MASGSGFSSSGSGSSPTRGWELIEAKAGSLPCQRSLHAGAVWKNFFIVFGGYDGQQRVSDLSMFNFNTSEWQTLSNVNAPSPRDRHVATVFENALYIFGGFDGVARVNDLSTYDLETNEWASVDVAPGTAPSPRHSHAACVYRESMFIFGGYDGSYRSDLHGFNFRSRRWYQVHCSGDVPRARYRGTCVVSEDSMILHGGHDGDRHLQDTHVFDFVSLAWSTLVTEGPAPSPRDSHVSVIFGKSMYLYGGSTGSAMGDFHELKLEFRRVWGPVCPTAGYGYGDAQSPSRRYSGQSESLGLPPPPQNRPQNRPLDFLDPEDAYPADELTPGMRFCHVGVVHESAFYIFGGYDGQIRLNDFLMYRFDQLEQAEPPSSLVVDMRAYVNCETLSDISFIVEGVPIHAHKILCLRCPYFRNMLTGDYLESRAREVVIPDVKYATFLQLLQYLYTDVTDVTVDTAMELFRVADRFGIDRLKRLCELEMLAAITTESVAPILYTADAYHAANLRERCIHFALVNFDEVSRTSGFEEMGRTNVELVFEILRRR